MMTYERTRPHSHFRALLMTMGTAVIFALPATAGASVWSPQFPSPAVESSESSLQSVSCTTAEACTAAGGYAKFEPGTRFALAERWDGSEWTPQSVPQPAGSPWAAAAGVSCPVVNFCVLTGVYIDEEGVRLPLVALWSGNTWTLQSVPVPEGSVYAGLEDVSCVSTTECVAVGQYSKKNTYERMQPYIVSWNGTKWTWQFSPLPIGGDGGGLAGISCTSSSKCVAAGRFYSIEAEAEIPEGSLIETWNGASWKAAQLGPAALEDVSCPVAEDCMAVSHSGEAWALSGSVWTEIEGPAPGSEAWFSGVRGISCISAEDCTAVGEYIDSAYRLYISVWDGAEWQLQTSVEPSETGLGTLEGVSCPAAGECIAVGESEYLAIAEHSE